MAGNIPSNFDGLTFDSEQAAKDAFEDWGLTIADLDEAFKVLFDSEGDAAQFISRGLLQKGDDEIYELSPKGKEFLGQVKDSTAHIRQALTDALRHVESGDIRKNLAYEGLFGKDDVNFSSSGGEGQ